MKLDTHVHTWHSGNTSIRPLRRVMRESYNAPERVYALAKSRGMDLVTITDHDQVSGALTLANRPDVIVGCELTGTFPHDAVSVHLNVFGLTEASHREVQRRRHDLTVLLPFLAKEQLFVSLNHVASGVNGPFTAAHVAALLPWIDGFEVRNGSRLAVQNRTAECLARATGKAMLGGSDSHTERGIGFTWTEVPHARTVDEFFAGLRAGRGVVGGRHGSPGTMSSDIVRFAGNLCREQTRDTVRTPWSRRTPALLVGVGLLGAPLLGVALVGGLIHFLREQQFNRELLFDLVAHPREIGRRVAELAA